MNRMVHRLAPVSGACRRRSVELETFGNPSMSLLGALQTSLSGLQVSQAQMQITSNNIANVNTLGYSRKTAETLTRTLAGQGNGVRLSEIQRNVDDRLLRQLQDHIARLSGQKIQSGYLRETQIMFGSLADNTSLGHRVTEFGSALEGLSTNPASLTNRTATVESGRLLASQLNTMTTNLQQMRRDADRLIETAVTTVNTLLTDIHTLNKQIAIAKATTDTVPDLEDQRDRLIDKLANEIDIQHFTRSTGEVVILTGTGRALLNSQPVTLTHTAAAQLSPSVTLGNGITGILIGTAGPDITSEITGGRLGGLITTRDQNLVDLQAQIDRLAEVLRDTVNKLHNDGTAFPPPQSLTGTRTVAAADSPSMTGLFRVTVVDADGVTVETSDINLATLAPNNIGALVAQIGAMTNATAAINASGKVNLAATGTNRITINELTSAVTTGNVTYGMGQFLGLNDFFDSGPDFANYMSDRVASNTAAVGLAGTLSFDVAGVTTNVAYVVGDSLTDIAASITGTAALGAANITATVVREGSGYRLEITDADSDNFTITDSGTLTSQINLRAGTAGTAQRIAVRQAILQNSGLVAHAESSGASPLAVGAIAVSAGDGTIARSLADAFTSNQTFSVAGGLPQRTTAIASYAAEILSVNANQANAIDSQIITGDSFRVALENQIATISAVNLDEELANIIVLQNAYAASARLTSVISDMLDILIELG